MLCAFIGLTVLTSYYRYVIAQDFMVTYEIDCDPTSTYCYIGCEDDDCTEEYFYQEVERYAATLLEFCGEDITDCEASYTCMTNEADCYVTSCNAGDSPDECAGPNL